MGDEGLGNVWSGSTYSWSGSGALNGWQFMAGGQGNRVSLSRASSYKQDAGSTFYRWFSGNTRMLFPEGALGPHEDATQVVRRHTGTLYHCQQLPRKLRPLTQSPGIPGWRRPPSQARPTRLTI